MKYTINEEICVKEGLLVEELLTLLVIKSGANISEIINNLLNKNIIIKNILGEYLISEKYNDKVETILLNADKEIPKEDRITQLAKELCDIFPAQKKQGTCHYFKGNKKEISLRLKKFFKIFGNYTNEQILNAAKSYVESFNGNYSYMRILKYFIWKDEIKVNSDGENYVAETSDLATWIENAGQEDSLKQDWTNTLI